MTTAPNEFRTYAGIPEVETSETNTCPPAFLEYMWYVSLAYAMLGQAWGVVIPSVGGGLLAVLAAACFLSTGAKASLVYAPAALALCTGISVIAVQFFFHTGLSLEHSNHFIGWLFTLISVQALSLRPGFINRFAMVAFAVGLVVIPFIQLDGGGGRAHASGTGVSNGNSLGMWFGFCAVYFFISGLQSRNLIQKVISWMLGMSCLYVVALTVSRGPLLGIVLACVVALRSALKRHFISVFSLALLAWVIYESGLFEQTIAAYISRGTEETGRGIVWPRAIQRLMDSPWTGVGLDDIRTSYRWNKAITPHNGLLHIALGAGVLPLLFFVGYLVRVAKGALHALLVSGEDEAVFLPPLVTFSFVEIMILDTAFMSAWVVVVFSLAVHFASRRVKCLGQESARKQKICGSYGSLA